MNFLLTVLILAVVQGLAELLPVSSSAHVIVAEKLLGRDPTSPDMTLLLLMLHTGTMLAVILYFWKSWKRTFFSSRQAMVRYGWLLGISTAMTGAIGYGLKIGIERVVLRNAEASKAEVEMLFGNLPLIAAALACAGVLILYAGLRRKPPSGRGGEVDRGIDGRQSALIGAVQGLCLPFRGFSRSGATISTGLLAGVSRRLSEEFSFALGVILTPPLVGMEILRVLKHRHELASAGVGLTEVFALGLLGMAFSFLAGMVALRWLSRWLEKGRWHYFGIYCLLAAAAVAVLHFFCGI